MTTAAQENARMLASVLGVGEDEAATRLARKVLVTVEDVPQMRTWAADISELLSLTVQVTHDASEPGPDIELVLGAAEPRSKAPTLYGALGRDAAIVTRTRKLQPGIAHPFLAACASPLVVGSVLSVVIADKALPGVALPATFRFDQLALAEGALARTRDLTGFVLAGAGAVGHGFVRALRHLPVSGKLAVIDPKTVAEGNFNRCTYLRGTDLGADKATVLAQRAQGDFSNLQLEAFVGDFGGYCKAHGPQKAVVVTVDSRRARRSIQSELPGGVIDASTTDVQSVVVHSHRQPTDGACLSCIYKHAPQEHARERAIADGLGVTLDDVAGGLITRSAAARIAQKYPEIDVSGIAGKAYDSLFKELCAAQTLKSDDGRQVLAPFSFVSAMAGAYLAVEMLRYMDEVNDTNYWAADPWGVPLRRRRVMRPRLPDCEFCSRPEFRAVSQELWGGSV